MEHNCATEECQASALDRNALNYRGGRTTAVPRDPRIAAGTAESVRAARVVTENRECAGAAEPASVGLHVGAALWLLRAAIERGHHSRRVALLLKVEQVNHCAALAIFGRQPARNEERCGKKEQNEQGNGPDSRKNHDH